MTRAELVDNILQLKKENKELIDIINGTVNVKEGQKQKLIAHCQKTINNVAYSFLPFGFLSTYWGLYAKQLTHTRLGYTSFLDLVYDQMAEYGRCVTLVHCDYFDGKTAVFSDPYLQIKCNSLDKFTSILSSSVDQYLYLHYVKYSSSDTPDKIVIEEIEPLVIQNVDLAISNMSSDENKLVEFKKMLTTCFDNISNAPKPHPFDFFYDNYLAKGKVPSTKSISVMETLRAAVSSYMTDNNIPLNNIKVISDTHFRVLLPFKNSKYLIAIYSEHGKLGFMEEKLDDNYADDFKFYNNFEFTSTDYFEREGLFTC